MDHCNPYDNSTPAPLPLYDKYAAKVCYESQKLSFKFDPAAQMLEYRLTPRSNPITDFWFMQKCELAYLESRLDKKSSRAREKPRGKHLKGRDECGQDIQGRIFHYACRTRPTRRYKPLNVQRSVIVLTRLDGQHIIAVCMEESLPLDLRQRVEDAGSMLLNAPVVGAQCLARAVMRQVSRVKRCTVDCLLPDKQAATEKHGSQTFAR